MEVQDVISSLPDEILEHILSFLPTKKAVSTSVLSKRWRNVFSLVPNLEFEFPDPLHLHETRPHYKSEYRREFIEFVEHILNLHGSSRINRFFLKYHLSFDQARFESWIVKALELGAVDLDLQSFTNPYGFVIYKPLPSLIFESKILVKLRLRSYYTIKLSQDACLPMLKTLYLTSVNFEGDPSVLETFISRCPVLEDLVVEEFRKQRSSWAFSVSSHSLKRLCLRFGSRCKLVLTDVPNVVYFEFSCPFWSRFSEFKLDSLVESQLDFYQCNSRLEGINTFANVKSLVNAIRNVRVLHLSQRVLELFYYYSKKLPLGFDNLVYLSVESAEKRGWQILPLLIKISPNLETVIFKGLFIIREYFEEDYYYDSEENMSSCLSSSGLKTLEISGDHKGTTRELSQMKHFLEKLPCLELVKIHIECKDWDYFEVIMDMVPGAILKCNNRVQVLFEPTKDKEAVSSSH